MTTADAGKPAFKIKGYSYNEFGFHTSPEILPVLGIYPEKFQPGPNTFPAGLIVRTTLTPEGKPRKIIGRDDGSAMSIFRTDNLTFQVGLSKKSRTDSLRSPAGAAGKIAASPG